MTMLRKPRLPDIPTEAEIRALMEDVDVSASEGQGPQEGSLAFLGRWVDYYDIPRGDWWWD